MRVTSAQLCDELRKQLRNIQTDSRLVAEGYVFVALPPAVPGERSKTASHIRMALEKGAWAVVASERTVERMKLNLRSDRNHAWLLVSDVRAQLGEDAPVVVALAGVNEDDKPMVAVATNEAARKAGIKAGDLVRGAAKVLGGGGGGKPDFAQGGGVDASKIDEALEALKHEAQKA